MKQTVLVSVIFVSLTVLHGCGSVKSDPDMITIASEPMGANVFVMGNRIGVTPLTIRQEIVFPLTYDPDKSGLYGAIVLRKTGCKDFQQRVSSSDYRYGIMAKLDCGQHTTESVEQRLRQLQDLHTKGLITDDEEKAARKRILDGI